MSTPSDCVNNSSEARFVIRILYEVVVGVIYTHFLKYRRTPLIRKLVIRTANNPDRLGPSSKFGENYTKLTCLELTSYRIKYSSVLRLIELQISCGRKV